MTIDAAENWPNKVCTLLSITCRTTPLGNPPIGYNLNIIECNWVNGGIYVYPYEFQGLQVDLVKTT